MNACPCGSKRSYNDCCQKFHKGEKCKTTEELLRARFSAFVKHLPTFLMDTHHPMHITSQLISDLQDSSFTPQNLIIMNIEGGQDNDHEGSITYSFDYKAGNKLENFTTTSLYSKMGSDWFYEKDI